MENNSSQQQKLIKAQKHEKQNLQPYIGFQHQAPSFMKNLHIIYGYRINYQCPKKVFKSAFTLHNQTLNIWTHLLPALLISFTLIYISVATYFVIDEKIISEISNFSENSQNQLLNHETNSSNVFQNYIKNKQLCSNNETIIIKKIILQQYQCELQNREVLKQILQHQNQVPFWPIYQFLIAATICLFCSAAFHLFHPISEKAFIKFNRLDVAGVFLLISSSIGPLVYYGLYCRPLINFCYLALCAVGGIGLFLFSLTDWFYKKEVETFRIFSCVGFGVLGWIPLIHMIIEEMYFKAQTSDSYNIFEVFPWVALLSGSYLLGVYFFSQKVPQKYFPGTFDIFGHSHQIWHCTVIMGIIFTYQGILEAYQLRTQSTCPLNI